MADSEGIGLTEGAAGGFYALFSYVGTPDYGMSLTFGFDGPSIGFGGGGGGAPMPADP